MQAKTGTGTCHICHLNFITSHAIYTIGKTLAFLLPAVERLLKLPNLPKGVSILVLSPSRELALQVCICLLTIQCIFRLI